MSFVNAVLAYIASYFMSDQGQSLLRGIVKWIGGLLVAKGWFDSSILDLILGSLGTLTGFVQSQIFHTSATASTATAPASGASS
jgi:hypothetical protein